MLYSYSICPIAIAWPGLRAGKPRTTAAAATVCLAASRSLRDVARMGEIAREFFEVFCFGGLILGEILGGGLGIKGR